MDHGKLKQIILLNIFCSFIGQKKGLAPTPFLFSLFIIVDAKTFLFLLLAKEINWSASLTKLFSSNLPSEFTGTRWCHAGNLGLALFDIGLIAFFNFKSVLYD